MGDQIEAFLRWVGSFSDHYPDDENMEFDLCMVLHRQAVMNELMGYDDDDSCSGDESIDTYFEETLCCYFSVDSQTINMTNEENLCDWCGLFFSCENESERCQCYELQNNLEETEIEVT